MPQPGTNTGSTPGFLTTTVRLCAGTKILTEIYESSPGRAVWRFFLVTILCAILASAIGTFVQKGAFDRAGRGLDEEIGAFEITPDKISFRKEPDTPRRLKLPYITLEYYPGNTFKSNDLNLDRTSDHGIIILPGGVASWASVNWNNEDVFYATLVPASALYASLAGKENAGKLDDVGAHWEMFSGPGLAESLKEEFIPVQTKTEAKAAATEDTPPVSVTGTQAARFARSVLGAIILLTTFGRNFLTIGLIILLVSLIQYLRASTLPKEIAFRNVLTIMVYSTFPAQIAATLFDAAGGSGFISFQFVFVGIFFVYQLFAFRAVIRKVCPEFGKKDDDYDDSDF